MEKFEVPIVPDGEYEHFYRAASIIEGLGIRWTKKVDGFDSLYWEFNYRDTPCVLHYNVYVGVSLYLDSEEQSSGQQEVVAELVRMVNDALTEGSG